MLKTITLKKKLNDSLLTKKLKENHYGLILNSFKSLQFKDQVSFTKLALKNQYLKSIFVNNKFHFPLTFVFFNNYTSTIQFLKTQVNRVIMLKLQNKMLKKNIIKNYLFSKNSFDKLNFNYIFLSY
jgi:uncharacterized protein YueI